RPRDRRRAPTQAAARRGEPGRALREWRLKRERLIHVVERRGAAEAVVRRTGRAGLGGDQHDTLAGTRAVDRGVRRAFQDLDVSDVVGIQVRGAVGRSGTAQEPQRRVRGVVDRHAVYYDERLPGTANRLLAADPDEG